MKNKSAPSPPTPLWRFKIIVNSYNSLKWIDKCLHSLEIQKYPYFDVCVTDDASEQEAQREIISKYCQRNGWIKIFNKTRKRAMHNIVQAVKAFDPNNEDVIAIVDGDDWLYNAFTLQKIASVYQNDPAKPWMTYGQYVKTSTGTIGHCRPPKWWWKVRRSYRKKPWIFGHMLTYKYFLFKEIKEQDLIDETGHYLPVECDLATIFPIMEMVGSHFSFIPDILYCYTDDNPIHDYRSGPHHLERTNPFIRSRKKYKRLKTIPSALCYSADLSLSS